MTVHGKPKRTPPRKPKNDQTLLHHHTWQTILNTINRSTLALREISVSEDDMPDAIGQCRAIEKKLADWRLSMTSETPAGIVGEKFHSVSKAKPVKRSYNTDGLLVAMMHVPDVDDGMHALRIYRSLDAVRLTWRWTEVKSALAVHRIPLTIAQQEVRDGDAELVGEIRDTEVKIEEIERD